MKRRLTTLMVAISVTVIGLTLQAGGSAGPVQAPQGKNVWDGVFAEGQAAAGQTLYEQLCANCHGPTLNGGSNQGAPPLKGNRFMENWREDHLESLYTKTKNTMPRRSDRVLTEKETVDIIAFTMRENGFPAGAELTAATLRSIQIQRKEGPRPLPNNALVEVMGCLTEDGSGEWALTTATAPVRVRSTDKITPDEVKAWGTKGLSAQTYKLANLLMLGAFEPAKHKGHKMLSKGLLSRRTAGEQLSVTEMEMVSDKCTP